MTITVNNCLKNIISNPSFQRSLIDIYTMIVKDLFDGWPIHSAVPRIHFTTYDIFMQ